MTHGANGALAGLMGESIAKIVINIANIKRLANWAAECLGEDVSDAMSAYTSNLSQNLSDVIRWHILDAIDAEVLLKDYEDLKAVLANTKKADQESGSTAGVINSPEVINTPSKKSERKAK